MSWRHLEDDEPLSEQEAADVQSALDDIEHGCMISLDDYEKELRARQAKTPLAPDSSGIN
jgi:hypothetical protein